MSSRILCPVCDSPSIRLVFGFPRPDDIEKALGGRIALGGCNVPDDPVPNRHCPNCWYEWRHEPRRSATAPLAG